MSIPHHATESLKFRAGVQTTAHTEKVTLVEMLGGGMDNLPSANNRAVEERGRRKVWRKQKT